MVYSFQFVIYRVEVQYVKTEKNLCNQKGISALLNIQTVKSVYWVFICKTCVLK